MGSYWVCAPLSLDVYRERIKSFAIRLCDIHPLFAETSWVGRRGSYAKMFAIPLVWEMNDAQWVDAFEKGMNRDGGVADPQYGYRLSFWNRRKQRKVDDESVEFGLRCNSMLDPDSQLSDTTSYNAIGVNGLPKPLVDPDIMMAIMQAQIGIFGADCSEVRYSNFGVEVSRGRFLTRHWRIWNKDGEPWPNPNLIFFDADQGEPATSEPWLGGTLYTWPEHAPWLALDAWEASRKQSD